MISRMISLRMFWSNTLTWRAWDCSKSDTWHLKSLEGVVWFILLSKKNKTEKSKRENVLSVNISYWCQQTCVSVQRDAVLDSLLSVCVETCVQACLWKLNIDWVNILICDQSKTCRTDKHFTKMLLSQSCKALKRRWTSKHLNICMLILAFSIEVLKQTGSDDNCDHVTISSGRYCDNIVIVTSDIVTDFI